MIRLDRCRYNLEASTEEETRMARYVLTVRSRSGKRLNGCTGSSTSVAVYSAADLKKRLAAVKKHPDYAVTYRRANA